MPPGVSYGILGHSSESVLITNQVA